MIPTEGPVDLRRKLLLDMAGLVATLQEAVNLLLEDQAACRRTPGCPIAAGTHPWHDEPQLRLLHGTGQPPTPR